MKFLILAVCVASAFAKPDVSHLLTASSNDRDAQILKQTADVGPEPGKYYWEIQTNNGIAAHEHGELKNAGSENEELYVGGVFGYKSPEGEDIQVKYEADKDGYRPQGAHLPTPPPIPEYILRALQWTAEHTVQDARRQK